MLSSFASDPDELPARVLSFDLWGDYACFRRFYTTASPLTFDVPPPTALAGILGAIVGTGKDEYMEVFGVAQCRLAVRLLQPVKKVRLGVNWVETKDSAYFSSGRIGNRTQIMVEYLKDPLFRVYAAPADQTLYAALRDNLIAHRSIFTVALGLSELLANFRFVGEYRAEHLASGKHDIVSVLPELAVRWPPAGQGIQFEAGKRYESQRLPSQMSRDRVVARYDQIVIETTAKPVRADVIDVAKVGDECVVFF